MAVGGAMMGGQIVDTIMKMADVGLRGYSAYRSNKDKNKKSNQLEPASSRIPKHLMAKFTSQALSGQTTDPTQARLSRLRDELSTGEAEQGRIAERLIGSGYMGGGQEEASRALREENTSRLISERRGLESADFDKALKMGYQATKATPVGEAPQYPQNIGAGDLGSSIAQMLQKDPNKKDPSNTNTGQPIATTPSQPFTPAKLSSPDLNTKFGSSLSGRAASPISLTGGTQASLSTPKLSSPGGTGGAGMLGGIGKGLGIAGLIAAGLYGGSKVFPRKTSLGKALRLTPITDPLKKQIGR